MTPMVLQYLVGLCCLRRNPEAVKIVLGDMVHDDAAGKARDVDVTITLDELDGTRRAFKAIEVKKEAKALDVATVEQLCMKFNDMPDITHRAVVSAAGFTDGALRKAERHGVELYSFVSWQDPIGQDFPSWGGAPAPQVALQFNRALLYWALPTTMRLTTLGGPTSFEVKHGQPLKTAKGEPHSNFGTFEAYAHELLLRSTGILWQLEPAQTLLHSALPVVLPTERVARSMPWHLAHTMDVGSDGAFLDVGSELYQVSQVTIAGALYWEWPFTQTEYKLLKRSGDGDIYAGAAVAEGRVPGELLCFVLDPTSPACGVHFVHLTPTQQKLLREVELQSGTAPS